MLEVEPADRSQVNRSRPTDSERDRLVGVLKDAFGRGDLSLDDFQARLDAAFEVESVGELEPLSRGLTAPSHNVERSNSKKRLFIGAGSGLLLLLVVLVVGWAVTESSGPDVPVITGLGVTNPLDSGSSTVIHIKWPGWAKDGFVQYSVTGGQTAPSSRARPAADIVKYNHDDAPISYRPAACRTQCRTTDPDSDPVYGPWYRPTVGAVLAAPPPSVTGTWNDDLNHAILTISLGEHTSAPVIVIYRDGVAYRTMKNESLRTGGNPRFEDTAPPRWRTSHHVSYAVAACYSDCSVPALQSGFAQATPPGPTIPVVVPPDPAAVSFGRE